ncbi:hypothetical protein [uncultured Tenacibaculum sp.]|uniref:hypothetical protein n=1 Tax=uncultured Tenacibaculum sp. TaxID=174713 RepID=UPI00261A3AE4|nr:hypothetical protein [uncultured Tenacibaculum sp.]
MRFKGNLVEKGITKNETLVVENLCNLYFKNYGSSTVKIGLITLKPYEETTIDTGAISTSTSFNISFDTTIGNGNNLYFRAINITGVICD